jgi:hypothetical protein
MLIVLGYHLRWQPSEVERLPYYEYEYAIDDLIEFLKEKNEKENGGTDQKAPSMPKMPSMPKFNIPKFK